MVTEYYIFIDFYKNEDTFEAKITLYLPTYSLKFLHEAFYRLGIKIMDEDLNPEWGQLFESCKFRYRTITLSGVLDWTTLIERSRKYCQNLENEINKAAKDKSVPEPIREKKYLVY